MSSVFSENKEAVQAIRDEFDRLIASGDPTAVIAKKRVEEANAALRQQVRYIPDHYLV